MADVKWSDNMADVKWSDNTAFPILPSFLGTDYFPGLHAGANAKWTGNTLLNYVNSNAQLESTSQVTGLVAALNSKLDLSGGTMTGFLVLNSDPTSNLEAATKQYVDNSVSTAPYVLLAGDTMTGLLTLSGDPVSGLQAATKQYVDNSISSTTFQDVYNNSSPPSFNVSSSGFSIKDPLGNSLLTIETGDGINFATALYAQTAVFLQNLTNNGETQFDGQSITNFVPINFGVNNPNFTFTAKSSIPSNSQTTAGTYQFGFSDESSSPSGFFKLNLIDQNVSNTLFYGTGTVSANIPHIGINSQLSVGISYGSSTNKNAILQLNSISQGFLPTSWTTTQENTNTGSFGSTEGGLSWYNNSLSVQSYWDGSQRQQLLSVDNCIQGTNMTLDTSTYPGKIVFNSSGGGSSGTQVQGTFTTSSTSTTSVGTTDSPINVASPLYFNIINAVGTNVATSTVSGITTPIIQNTSTGGRWGIARFDLTMNFSTSATTTFGFTVYTNSGSTTFFKNVTLTYSSTTSQQISFSSPLIYLNTNDYMYLAVSCSTGTASFSARTFQGSWVDTTIASLPSTDALIQGSSNVYLSLNGGTDYEYMSGVATIGDLAQFNSVGGQFIDSGIAAANVILSTGSYSDPSWLTSLNGSKITAASIDLTTKVTGILPNANTTATSANTASTIVARDSSGNFLAGTITAALTGNASTATTLQTARAINGVNFDGSAPITITAAAGTLTGTTLNSTVVSSSLTSVATIMSGTWSGSFGAISGANLTALTAANISAGTAGINISGNASTVTTNANLTGPVTSVGNATTVTALSITNAMLAGSIDLTSKVTGVLPNANTTATSANTASAIVSRDASGNFSAGTITAALTGNASTATNAAFFFTTAVSNNASFYPILVNQTTNSYQSALLNSGFSINPSTGTVTATTFSGALSGNATTATTATNANNVATTQVSSNASYYPLMAASSTNSNQAADLGTGLTYNPSTNTLSTTALTLSSLTLRSVLYTSAGAGIIGDSSNFVYDGSGHNLYIGTNNISTLNGHGRLNLLGTDSTVSNSLVAYTTTDLYPLLQILPFSHDNVSLNFDAYYSAGWISSFSSSSFQITKSSGALNLNYAAVTAGSTITWATGLSLSSAGVLTLNGITKATTTTFAGGASGNYTPPTGCTSIIVRGWGSGGGGGGVAGAAASAGAAGGGGSGGYFLALLTAPFGAPFSYSVGSGGAGGAAGANNGTNGATTTFGSFTAGAGLGGVASTAGVSAAIVAGGNVNAGSGSPDILTPGMSGLAGLVLSSTVASAGYGGNSPAGGSGGRAALNGNGSPGDIPGGGGGGGAGTNATNRAGGNGADGKIIIYEYYNG